MKIISDLTPKNQYNNNYSAKENLNLQQPSFRDSNNHLNKKHYKHCCGNDITKKQRGLNPDWIKSNCSSVSIAEATEFLRYSAKSPGILIKGANGQYQFRPDQPWSDRQGKKAPKYRTAFRDEYDALLPAHPIDKNYWNNIKKLKQQCYQIDGHPMLLIKV